MRDGKSKNKIELDKGREVKNESEWDKHKGKLTKSTVKMQVIENTVNNPDYWNSFETKGEPRYSATGFSKIGL